MLTYLMGMSRAGKTTYSMRCTQGGGPSYLSFDKLWDYSRTADDQWEEFATKIQQALDEHGDVIIDGMMYLVVERLHERFPGTQPVFAYTKFDIIKSRISPANIYGCSHEGQCNSMVTFYQTLADHNPYFMVGGDAGAFTTMSPHAFFTYLGDPWKTEMEQWLVDRVDTLNCDVKYSPVKVGDVERPGYERAILTLSRIKGLVDWTGANVLEYGPHMAYAALHHYARFAKHVELVEQSQDACKGIRWMANYMGLSNISVKAGDIMSYQTSEKPDIVLCLNMFYGLSDKRDAALRLWERDPSHVIVETNEQDFLYLDAVATSRGYTKATYPGRTNCSGHNRLIVHYTRS